jgi:hypothetical protein
VRLERLRRKLKRRQQWLHRRFQTMGIKAPNEVPLAEEWLG